MKAGAAVDMREDEGVALLREDLVDLVVKQQIFTVLADIERYECLVAAVAFIARLVRQPCAVAGIRHHGDIVRLQRSN